MANPKKPTQFYATASTTIVLVMLSFFLLLFLHSSRITNIAKENLNILVEVEDNLLDDQKNALLGILKEFKGVKLSSIVYIPKDAAKKQMSEEMSILDTSIVNPFKDVIKFNIESELYSEDLIKTIKDKLELEKGVLGVFHENENIKAMKANLLKISFGILMIAICFIILAVAIIFNTIKLTLYSDIKEIKTMQMVGAENEFIKKPYLKTAFSIAIRATCIMSFIVIGLCFWLWNSDELIKEILDWKLVAATILVAGTTALCIQIITTNLIIRRFLNDFVNN